MRRPIRTLTLLTLTLSSTLPVANAASGGPAVGLPTAQDEAEVENPGRPVLRHVRAREGGLTARNIYDVQAVPLMDVASGGLLAVYGERSGWLEVEAPGGFPVWVYGRFLRPTDQAAVYEVTRNDVYLRPNPDTSQASFPLNRRLQAGDLVTAVELPPVDAPLSDTWVRIWTPPGVGAWVQAARTEPLGQDEDGAALWASAEAALFELAAAEDAPLPVAATPAVAITEATPAPRTTVRNASTATVGRAAEALASARALLETERERPLPDFGAVEAALQGVLELTPDATTRGATLNELEKLELLKDKVRLEAQLADQQQRELEALTREQEQIWNAGGERILQGPFAERGVVELYRPASGRTALRLSRGGQVIAELVCTSGRYDLEVFLGAEVRLGGLASGAAMLHPGVAQVEVESIEVLAVRRR
ncbi:MAG: SH3 domain-containing protein [Planctomycetota bacterium]|jgi:hypothetical protein